jgi:alkanesulfonate monooxygenase SsuD/methylene tetrahydromethanopterin reductase-like flavin-dependent oxidoreductase (luciferase family)
MKEAPMFLMYFTERPYAEISEDVYKQQGMRSLLFSNENLEPVAAGRLYNRYLDEKLYAEEVGFDGLMLNEHHNTPASLGSVIDIEAAILARITKKPRIVLLGNVLPINENPLRLAEETAMIDCISGGRLVPGFVRGGGVEQLATNANPAYNRERFEEAHDLIVKAWTTPGPFRWEGKHFQYRVVNPWIRPIQQPPPVWIPGSASPETLIWCAERHYPYVALATLLPTTQDMFKIYGDAAKEVGYDPGPQNFGYLQRIQVQETEENAYRAGKGFTYVGAVMGLGGAVNQAWNSPPGYRSRLAQQNFNNRRTIRGGRTLGQITYDEALENYQIIVGTPKTVVPRVRHVLETLRPGVLGIWGNDGTINHDDTTNSMRLMGQEVMPAVREISRELGLTGPFEKKP